MSKSKKQLPDQVAPEDAGVKAVRKHRPIRSRVYYEERRKRVAELRTIGNLSFDQIGERIATYGFEPMTGDRAWRDYRLYMKESAKALNSVEHRSEIVTKFEGLFSLAIMAYKDAQRQTKEGTRVPDPYAQGILLQRAMEILERLAELYGFLSRRGFSVTQTQVQTQGQTMDAEQRKRVLYEVISQYRAERGLAPLRFEK
ncbi:MAG: hypothetical protein V2A71_01265 [Candidatus Eisenbacteria bacterium]